MSDDVTRRTRNDRAAADFATGLVDDVAACGEANDAGCADAAAVGEAAFDVGNDVGAADNRAAFDDFSVACGEIDDGDEDVRPWTVDLTYQTRLEVRLATCDAVSATPTLSCRRLC